MRHKKIVSKKRKSGKKIVAVSGGFDPVHVGHVRMFREARKMGDELVVILNNDNWLRAKKHHIFMPEHERKEVIEAIRGVDRVVLTKHPAHPADMTVVAELREIRPHIFANGGDRNKADAAKKESSLNPEQILCQELGIEMRFGVGKGGKLQSSSWLLKNYVEAVMEMFGGSGKSKKKKR